SAVNCNESITRNISLKLRPVEAGYVRVNLIFLSGPITNTERTVAVADAFGCIISYSSATLRSLSAMIGKSTSAFWVSLISLIHRSEEHTSELQSRENLVCRLLLEKK